MRDPKAEGRRWLKQAEYDLGTAEWLFEGERWPAACFSAQQAAEKAIKAFLYATGKRVVTGHSVVELAREAAAKEPRFEDFEHAGAILDRFYVPTRYPNGLPGGTAADFYGKEDASGALDLARKVVEFVRSLPVLAESED